MAQLKTFLVDSACSSLLARLYEMRMNSDSGDLDLVCGDKEWRVHSSILALRSPFFKTAISNIKLENKEMKIDIRALDPEAMLQTVNFMYGIRIGEAPIQFLFEAAERFLMDDMKEVVVGIAKRGIAVENAVDIGKLAELYNVQTLLKDCTDFIVNNHIVIKEELPPKFTMSLMSAMQKALKDGKKKSEDYDIRIKALEFQKKSEDYDKKVKEVKELKDCVIQ